MKYSIFFLCYYYYHHEIANLHICHRNREIQRKTNSTPNQDMVSNYVIIINPEGLREGEIGQYDIELCCAAVEG